MTLEGLALRLIGALVLGMVVAAPALSDDKGDDTFIAGPIGWTLVALATGIVGVVATLACGRWGWIGALARVRAVFAIIAVAGVVGFVVAPFTGNANLMPAMALWTGVGLFVGHLVRRLALYLAGAIDEIQRQGFA